MTGERRDAAGDPEQSQESGDTRRAISRSVVSLLKEHLGRGPLRARTYVNEDSVLVLMFEGHTTTEETLRQGGEEEAVASQRVRSSEVLRERLTAVVEAETGRKVIGYMSGSQQDPSLISYVFVLESSVEH